ncbi:MAG: 7,8-dihydro-6-hydroxymethylpterin dimethyltransferase [Promethearchaeota archaeon]
MATSNSKTGPTAPPDAGIAAGTEPYEKHTTSICPECMTRIPATIVEVREDLIVMRKQCPQHGEFEDVIANGVDGVALYKASQRHLRNGTPNANPEKKVERGCPFDCGICGNHKSAPACAMVDVTNRCNLNCPVCFANANQHGQVVEWTYEEILRIYRHFRSIKPKPPAIAMMAGGEPTVRDDLPDIIRELALMGFRQIQIATNGIRFAKDIEYYRRCLQAAFQPGTDCGIVIYLQFDGTTPETYVRTRGLNVFPYKDRLVQNAKQLAREGVVSSGICLVATITKDNVFEVPNIIRYAAENIEVVSGVMFQPVAFCGRISDEQLKEMRITTYDVIQKIDEETGGVLRPWRPFPAYHSLMNFVAWYNGDTVEGWVGGGDSTAYTNQVEFTCNPQCGFVTFLHVDRAKDGTIKYDGVQRLVHLADAIDFTERMWEEAKQTKRGTFFEEALGKITGSLGDLGRILDDFAFWGRKLAKKYKFILGALRYIKLENLLDPTILHTLNVLFRPSWWTTRNFLVEARNLYVGVMHFQDAYDLDVERCERCLVQYGVISPEDGNVYCYPFCAFNTCHRDRVEKEIAAERAVPLQAGDVELVRE